MLNLGTYQANTPAAEQVAVSIPDWRRHCYLIGATGGGKSNLLKQLMAGRPAFCLIDKEGDLAREVADAMPCIYWRARDYSHPIGINPFRYGHPDDRSSMAAAFVAMLSDIWNLGEHTPQLTDTLYAAVRLALDTQDAAPTDLPRILTDDAFRGYFLRKCRDRETREFWEEFNSLAKKEQRQLVSSTLNKVRAFTRSLPLRLALGQTTSSIDIREIMDEGKTLVVDLSGIGAEPARLLGAAIVFQFYLAAQARTEERRPDYTLFIDEFEDFASRTMPDILSKSRKRGLALCIAHQYVTQIDETIRDAIFANCGTFVVFNVGELDAPLLSKVLHTASENLTGQATGNAWAAVMHNGRRHRALPISIPEMHLGTGHLERNINVTNTRHARTRSDVQYMLDWYERVKWAREQYKKDKPDPDAFH